MNLEIVSESSSIKLKTSKCYMVVGNSPIPFHRRERPLYLCNKKFDIHLKIRAFKSSHEVLVNNKKNDVDIFIGYGDIGILKICQPDFC